VVAYVGWKLQHVVNHYAFCINLSQKNETLKVKTRWQDTSKALFEITDCLQWIPFWSSGIPLLPPWSACTCWCFWSPLLSSSRRTYPPIDRREDLCPSRLFWRQRLQRSIFNNFGHEMKIIVCKHHCFPHVQKMSQSIKKTNIVFSPWHPFHQEQLLWRQVTTTPSPELLSFCPQLAAMREDSLFGEKAAANPLFLQSSFNYRYAACTHQARPVIPALST